MEIQPAAPIPTTPPPSVLHGWRRSLARLAWAFFALLGLAAFVLAVPAHYGQLTTIASGAHVWDQLNSVNLLELFALGIPLSFYADYMLALEVLLMVVFAALAVLIFWRRSDDGMALFVSATSILYAATSVPAIDALVLARPAWHLPLAWIEALGLGSGLLLFYIFPDRRFVPGFTRWLAVLWTAWVLVWPLFPSLNPDQWPFPWPILTKLGWYATGIAAQIYRYRRYSTPVQRQQTKWVLFGFFAVFAGFFLFNLPFIILSHVPNFPFYLMVAYPAFVVLPMLSVAFSLAFACLKYRLWDIDLLISRSLLYASLSAVVALGYFGIIVLLQALLRTLTGARQPEIVTALSTLVIAAAFQPVRRQLQRFIDRRFYRRRYNAQKTLAAFSARVRDEVDLDVLAADLLAVIDKTVQPARVSLWLREGEMGGPEERRG